MWGWARAALITLMAMAGVGLSVGAARAASAETVSSLSRSTVCVLAETPKGDLTASGFVVPPGNRIVTTAHGLSEARRLRVKLDDGRIFAARLDRLGDERVDLALLVLPDAKLPPVTFGTVESLAKGDEVSTMGCPLGFEFSVTRGVVSAIRPSDEGYPMIQTDVSVNPGSSGGPLFDEDGKVVGIIKSRAVARSGIHLALPIDLAIRVLEQGERETGALERFNQALLEPRLEAKAEMYRQVVRDAPNLAEAHYNLGLALERLDRPAEAATAYRKTLELRPGSESAALNLSALCQQLGRVDEAIAVTKAALAVHPASTRLRNNLAEAYRVKGNGKAARREFSTILIASPDYAPAHYGLGLVYEGLLRDPKKAREHWRRYLALAPDAADAAEVRRWLSASDQAPAAEAKAP